VLRQQVGSHLSYRKVTFTFISPLGLDDGLYSILDIVIKNSSKLAIAISKKY